MLQSLVTGGLVAATGTVAVLNNGHLDTPAGYITSGLLIIAVLAQVGQGIANRNK